MLATTGQNLDHEKYNALIQDINSQDLKTGQTGQQLKQLASYSGNLNLFKRDLASYLSSNTAAYQELKECIF